MRSRDVLMACRQALEDFQAAGPTPYWRTRWVGLVAQLRSVGHVLDKIDGKQSIEWRHAVDEAWSKCKDMKPEPRILWDFIEAERNNALKAFEVGAQQNTILRPGSGALSLSGSIVKHQANDDTSYETFLSSGIYSGRDAITVCCEAIDFWDHYLNQVETAAQVRT